MKYCQNLVQEESETTKETKPPDPFVTMIVDMATSEEFWVEMYAGYLVGEILETSLTMSVVFAKVAAKHGSKQAAKAVAGGFIKLVLKQTIGWIRGELIEQAIEEVSELVVKKVASQTASTAAKASAGPIGWALMIVDIVSMTLDVAEMSCMMSMDQDAEVQKRRCKNIRGYLLQLQNSLLTNMQKNSLVTSLVTKANIEPELAEACKSELEGVSLIELQSFFDEHIASPFSMYYVAICIFDDEGVPTVKVDAETDLLLFMLDELGVNDVDIDLIKQALADGVGIQACLEKIIGIDLDETLEQAEDNIKSKIDNVTQDYSDSTKPIPDYVANPEYNSTADIDDELEKTIKNNLSSVGKGRSNASMSSYIGGILIVFGILLFIGAVTMYINTKSKMSMIGIMVSILVIAIGSLVVSGKFEGFEEPDDEEETPPPPVEETEYNPNYNVTPSQIQMAIINAYKRHILKVLDPVAFQNKTKSELIEWNFDMDIFLETSSLGGLNQISFAVGNSYVFSEKGCNNASVSEFGPNGQKLYTDKQLVELVSEGKKMRGKDNYLVYDRYVEPAFIKSDDISVVDGKLISTKSGKDTIQNLKYMSIENPDEFVSPDREKSAVPIIDSDEISSTQQINLIDATGTLHSVQCGVDTKSDEFKLPCFELSTDKVCKFGNKDHKQLVENPEALPDDMYAFKKFFMKDSSVIKDGGKPAVKYDPATGSAKISEKYCIDKGHTEYSVLTGQKRKIVKSEPHNAAKIGTNNCQKDDGQTALAFIFGDTLTSEALGISNACRVNSTDDLTPEKRGACIEGILIDAPMLVIESMYGVKQLVRDGMGVGTRKLFQAMGISNHASKTAGDIVAMNYNYFNKLGVSNKDFQRYKMALILGGGAGVAGLAVYDALTKKHIAIKRKPEDCGEEEIYMKFKNSKDRMVDFVVRDASGNIYKNQSSRDGRKNFEYHVCVPKNGTVSVKGTTYFCGKKLRSGKMTYTDIKYSIEYQSEEKQTISCYHNKCDNYGKFNFTESLVGDIIVLYKGENFRDPVIIEIDTSRNTNVTYNLTEPPYSSRDIAENVKSIRMAFDFANGIDFMDKGSNVLFTLNSITEIPNLKETYPDSVGKIDHFIFKGRTSYSYGYDDTFDVSHNTAF